MHKTKVKLQLSTKAGSSASGGGVLGVDGGGAFLPQPTEAPMLPTEAQRRSVVMSCFQPTFGGH